MSFLLRISKLLHINTSINHVLKPVLCQRQNISLNKYYSIENKVKSIKNISFIC
jgi:hypothetical protein